MMILHCRQSWKESKMIIGYAPPSTTATPTMQYGEGPAEQREITPLGPTTLTTITTARQLKMDSSLNDKIPVKGRDPPTGKGVEARKTTRKNTARRQHRTVGQEGPKKGSNTPLTTLWI